MKNLNPFLFILSSMLFLGIGCKGPSVEEVLTKLQEKKVNVEKVTEYSSVKAKNTVDEYFSYLAEVTARTVMVDINRKKFGKWVKSRSIQDFCSRYILSSSTWEAINSSCQSSNRFRTCGDEVYAFPKVKAALKKMLEEQGVNEKKDSSGWFCLK